jgi:hypothetical protein
VREEGGEVAVACGRLRLFLEYGGRRRELRNRDFGANTGKAYQFRYVSLYEPKLSLFM